MSIVKQANLEPCEHCQNELDVSDFEPFSNVICPHCSQEMRVKKQFGSYQLTARHAVGGMSLVFVAHDDTLSRDVAVKILNEEYSTSEIRSAQFENEARLTAAVSHPHVVRLYTVGKAFGRFYIAMELIEGKSLEACIAERGALPEVEMLTLASEVTAGLQAAHHAGVLHRDMKPGNILIDHNNHAKIVDFGLALITKDGNARAEEIWATPYYVPPEALEFAIEDLRSDLYALGATLYHALSGHPPFTSTTTTNKALHEEKKNIPSLGKVAPWLQASTVKLIDCMMAYSPTQRPNSYQEVLDRLNSARLELDRLELESPVHSYKRLKRRDNYKKRKKILTIAGVAAIFLIAFFFYQKKNDPVKNPVARNPDINFGQSTLEGNAGPDENTRLARQWDKARSLVAAKDYQKAEKIYLAIMDDKESKEPNASWAGLEAAIAANLDGRPSDARRHAQTISQRLNVVSDSSAVAVKLQKISRQLRDDQPESTKLPDFGGEDIATLAGGFALALKSWEEGDYQGSARWLSNFEKTSKNRDYPWLENYQVIARSYLHDAQILRDTDWPHPPRTVKETEKLLSALEDAYPKIQTHGRARYNIRARQAWLKRQKIYIESHPQGLPSSSAELLAAAADFATQGEFALAANALSLPATDDSGRDRTNAMRFLYENASAFLTELQLPEKATHIPSELLAKNQSLSEKAANPLQKNRLREQAICYQWCVGQKNQALIAAEKLAEDDSGFRQRWLKCVDFL